MILIFLTVLILLMINFGNGIIIRNLLKIETRSFVLTSFLGMISIALLETVFAFFFPLNSSVEILFILIGFLGTVLFFMKREKTRLKIETNFWFYFFGFIIIFASSFSPYLYDHYSYYLPTIAYVKELGFVKGISNFDLLLGQTSFWHIYQAGFSHFADPFLKINSYLAVLFLIYVYERKQYFLLVFLPMFLLFVQQPSPDLPIVIITLIVINELMNARESSILLYLSLFAVCIKPIVFWLPLFLIFNHINQRKFDFKAIFSVFVFGILLMMKNLWLFGFPIFPAALVDFDLPWKPSQEILNYSSQIGLMKSYDMKYSYQQVIGFDLMDSIYNWFTIGYKSILNIGVIVSLSIIGFFAWRRKSRFYYLLLICLIIKSIFIISFSAQYRFFIDVYVIALFLMVKDFSEERLVFTAVFLSIFILVVFTFPVFVQQFNMGKRMSDFSFSQLYRPRQLKITHTNKEFRIGNFSFKVSKSFSGEATFPTVNIYNLRLYEYYGIFPQYLGTDLHQGIFQRKLSVEEKIQLKKIIAETEKLKH